MSKEKKHKSFKPNDKTQNNNINHNGNKSVGNKKQTKQGLSINQIDNLHIKPFSKVNDARAGQFWSINTQTIRGHRGLITKRNKNSKIDAVVATHSPNTFGRPNLPLIENPDNNDTKKSYVLSEPVHTSINKLGKYHPEMVIKNSTDKAVIRNIKTKKR